MAHKWTDKQLAALEKRLRQHYSQAAAEMQAKQQRVMAAYQSEATRLSAELARGSITPEQYRNLLANYALRSQWYGEMASSLAEGALNADLKAMDLVNNEIPKVYSENYNFMGYMVESGLNIATSFTLVNEDAVRNLISKNPDLVPKWKINSAKDYTWNKQKFNSAITQGVLQGESVDAISKRIESVIGMNSRTARLNARTALTAAQNAGRLQSLMRMKENGIDVRKQWIATLDRRTRDSHRAEDKNISELEDRFPNTGLMYPGDMSTNDPGEVYNCRCTMIGSFDAVSSSVRSRYSKLGKQSYKSWKRGRK